MAWSRYGYVGRLSNGRCHSHLYLLITCPILNLVTLFHWFMVIKFLTTYPIAFNFNKNKKRDKKEEEEGIDVELFLNVKAKILKVWTRDPSQFFLKKIDTASRSYCYNNILAFIFLKEEKRQIWRNSEREQSFQKCIISKFGYSRKWGESF